MGDDVKPESFDNNVVAVIRAESDMQAAIDDLGRQGFEPEGIRVFTSEDAATRIDATGHHGGLLRKIGKAMEGHLSDEDKLLEEYQEAAERGARVIAVPVQGDQAEIVKEILQGHNGENIRYFGNFAVTDLEDQGRARS